MNRHGPLFDHFGSLDEERVGHREAKRFRGLEVDHQLVFSRRLHRQVCRLLTLEDAIDVAGGAPEFIEIVRPVGDQAADASPNYRYNPDYQFKGIKSKEAFTIKPGPNNPVGSYWIGLSAEGYGIHGTPNPSKVSKSDSHGCVRLTNWDVGLPGRNVRKGTPVEFVEYRRLRERVDQGTRVFGSALVLAPDTRRGRATS
jgi:hypothetical protein